MKKMMKEDMHAQAHFSKTFSKEEIADAYEIVVRNQEEFLSATDGGKRLRQEVVKHFKDSHPECTTNEQLAMQADLEDDIDAKNVFKLKIDAEDYADNLLNTSLAKQKAMRNLMA